MICEHPECTGSHDDRRFATLCPRSRENKRAAGRRQYERWTGYQRNRKLLRTRRIRALQRMNERGLRGPVQGEG